MRVKFLEGLWEYHDCGIREVGYPLPPTYFIDVTPAPIPVFSEFTGSFPKHLKRQIEVYELQVIEHLNGTLEYVYRFSS